MSANNRSILGYKVCIARRPIPEVRAVYVVSLGN